MVSAFPLLPQLGPSSGLGTTTSLPQLPDLLIAGTTTLPNIIIIIIIIIATYDLVVFLFLTHGEFSLITAFHQSF